MPTLSDPKLTITVDNGTTATVTASVDVSFDAFEKTMISAFSLEYTLTCRIFGDDIAFDNGLFQLGFAMVNSDQSDLTFSRVMPRSALNEDSDGGDDEIFARFTCKPPTGLPVQLPAAEQKDSEVVTGSF